MNVEWGKTSSILLGLILLSFIPVIQQWHDTGDFPTSTAWISAALAVVLGAGRYAQSIWPGPVIAEPVPETGGADEPVA